MQDFSHPGLGGASSHFAKLEKSYVIKLHYTTALVPLKSSITMYTQLESHEDLSFRLNIQIYLVIKKRQQNFQIIQQILAYLKKIKYVFQIQL